MGPSAIQPLQPAQALTSLQPVKPAKEGAGGFVNLIADFTKEVDQMQHKASDQIAELAAGKTDNIHQVMLELGKAEISFNYMMEVRSRLLEAYKEIMRMPI